MICSSWKLPFCFERIYCWPLFFKSFGFRVLCIRVLQGIYWWCPSITYMLVWGSLSFSFSFHLRVYMLIKLCPICCIFLVADMEMFTQWRYQLMCIYGLFNNLHHIMHFYLQLDCFLSFCFLSKYCRVSVGQGLSPSRSGEVLCSTPTSVGHLP